MAVSAAEFDNHTGNTKRDNLLAIDVDSGASEHYFDDTPGLRGRLSEYEVLEEPRKITTAGKRQLEGNTTGVITGTITDKAGAKQPVKLPIVVVPGLARNLFSVPQAASQGVVTTFVADASRTETDSFVLPLKQVRGTRDLYSFDLELDTPGLVLQVTRIHTANNRHRRVGHVNAKSLDLLNKADGNGMRFVEKVLDCDVCTIGESTQRAHPKKAGPEESRPQRQQSFWAGLHRLHRAYCTCCSGRLRICEQHCRRVHQVDIRVPHPDQTGSRRHDPDMHEVTCDTLGISHSSPSYGPRNRIYRNRI